MPEAGAGDVLAVIPPQLFTGGMTVSLVSMAVWLIYTGRLISRTAHEDRIADLTKHVEYLRKTLEVRDEEVRIRSEQVQKLLTNSDLTVQLLQSLQREARGALPPT